MKQIGRGAIAAVFWSPEIPGAHWIVMDDEKWMGTVAEAAAIENNWERAGGEGGGGTVRWELFSEKDFSRDSLVQRQFSKTIRFLNKN